MASKSTLLWGGIAVLVIAGAAIVARPYFAGRSTAKTGENRMISSAWLLEAVPAFVTHADDRRAELTPTAEGAARGK